MCVLLTNDFFSGQIIVACTICVYALCIQDVCPTQYAYLEDDDFFFIYYLELGWSKQKILWINKWKKQICMTKVPIYTILYICMHFFGLGGLLVCIPIVTVSILTYGWTMTCRTDLIIAICFYIKSLCSHWSSCWKRPTKIRSLIFANKYHVLVSLLRYDPDCIYTASLSILSLSFNL